MDSARRHALARNFFLLKTAANCRPVCSASARNHGIARRANALLLLDDGKSRAGIAGVLYLDDDTVRGWRKPYLAEGRDAVVHDGWWKGGQSRMTGAQGAGPCRWLGGRICRSTHEIRAHIRARDLASAIPIRAV